MSANTWLHRAARVTVRPLCGTRIRPNHLTTLRLLTGLAAVAGFAHGGNRWVMWGGSLFVLSAFLDRADGELARLGGLTSPKGHLYDLVSDASVNALVFIGIGIGLHRTLGDPVSTTMGVVAGAGVALAFWLVTRAEAVGMDDLSGGGAVDPDDALLIVGLAAWLGLLEPLLLAACIGAPSFALWLMWRLARRDRPQTRLGPDHTSGQQRYALGKQRSGGR